MHNHIMWSCVSWTLHWFSFCSLLCSHFHLLLALPSIQYLALWLVIFYSYSSKLCELSIGSYCAASSTLDNIFDIANQVLRNSSQFSPSFLCRFPWAQYLLRGTLTWTGSCVDNLDTGLGECLKDYGHIVGDVGSVHKYSGHPQSHGQARWDGVVLVCT